MMNSKNSSYLGSHMPTAEGSVSSQVIDNPVGDNGKDDFTDSVGVQRKESPKSKAEGGSSATRLVSQQAGCSNWSTGSTTQGLMSLLHPNYEIPPPKFDDVTKLWESNHDDRVEADIDGEKFNTKDFKKMKSGGVTHKIIDSVLKLLIALHCSAGACVVIPSHLSTEWFSCHKFDVEDGEVYLDKSFVTAILVPGNCKETILNHWILMARTVDGTMYVYDSLGCEDDRIKLLKPSLQKFKFKCYGNWFDDIWRFEHHPIQQDLCSCGLLCMATFQKWADYMGKIIRTDEETCRQFRIDWLNLLLQSSNVPDVKCYCLFCHDKIRFEECFQCSACRRRVHLECEQTKKLPNSQSSYYCLSCKKLLKFQSQKTKQILLWSQWEDIQRNKRNCTNLFKSGCRKRCMVENDGDETIPKKRRKLEGNSS